MKLRIYKNSIRFRLSMEDIAELKDNAFLQAQLAFSREEKFSYGVFLEDVGKIQLHYSPGEIKAIVPTETSNLWLESKRVGLKTFIETEDGEVLLILEKDLRPKNKPTVNKG